MIRHRLRLQEEEVLGQLRTKGQTMFASSRTPPRQKSCRLYSGVGRWQEVDADQNLSQTGGASQALGHTSIVYHRFTNGHSGTSRPRNRVRGKLLKRSAR